MAGDEYVPQLTTLVKTPPSGDEWLHEIKLDGYRIGCLIGGGRVRLVSRNGQDWTGRFPEIADAARTLPVDSAVIDGELVVLQPDGRTNFEAMQRAASGRPPRAGLVYFAFDLLRLDGERIDRLPLETRKARLLKLVGDGKTGRIRYTEHVLGRGVEFFEQARRLGLEGIISKRRDLSYQPGTRDGWRKTKCLKHERFVIGGFTDPEGSRAGFGALLVGRRDGSRLVFSGRVGTGFSHALTLDIRGRLDALARKTPPFDPPPPPQFAKNAHWVEPSLACEVTFIEWTDGGVLRHPSFQGLVTQNSKVKTQT
jgi:bifunctional non-homologous end joining protein LigD